MTLADWILSINAVAILLAPLVALWIGGILQRRSDSHKAKLDIFATLIGQRYDPQSIESVRALNMIDIVFADNSIVRDAWTQYIATLNDPNLNCEPGLAIRDEKRRQLLLEIVKALGLQRKISSADLLRAYMPTFAFEAAHVAMMERSYKRSVYEQHLKDKGAPPTLWTPPASQPAPTDGNASKPPAQSS
jgi:hypothetical protein